MDDIFHIGAILKDPEYVLPTTTKPKYLIVLNTKLDEVVFFGLTTSKKYCPEEHLVHGPVRYKQFHAYCFCAGIKIGKNGFAFPEKTIVSHTQNMHKVRKSELTVKNIEYIDTLTSEELLNLLYSYYTSSKTSQIHKNDLEENLSRLTGSSE